MDLYVSWPAVSQRDSFMRFCWGGGFEESSVEVEAGEGPTLTMREPNSTPMVTSWWGEKRPSQRRIVSCGRRSVSGRRLFGVEQEIGEGGLHWICRSRCRRYRRALRCSPTVVTFGKGGFNFEGAFHGWRRKLGSGTGIG